MFEAKTNQQVFEELSVDPKVGLSASEAEARLQKYGKNQLEEKKKKSWFMLFLSQFNDPMIYVLIAAAVISMLIGIYESVSTGVTDLESFADVIIIVVVILLNATIGTIQEAKAENALEALKKLSSPESLVRRDGQLVKIKSNELVPGDIVLIEEGDTIGADLRLIETHNFKTNESSLTGESLPIEKDSSFVFTDEVAIGDRVNCAYMSTPAVYGRAEGVVIATGMNTEIGKIATLLSEEEEEQTPLQKRLADLSKLLGILAIVIIVLMFIVGIIWEAVNHNLTPEGWVHPVIELFMNAIALAVAAVPEGLPAVVTIVLAVGVQRMVKANTIVRKLPSVETLGAVSFVCSDKTGTLTQNKMTVVKAYMDGKIIDQADFTTDNSYLLAKGMALCSNATIDEAGGHGDPTEIALVEYLRAIGYNKADVEKTSPRVNEYPFDSVRKMMSTQHEENGKKIIFTKGAIDNILLYSTKIYEGGKERPITQADKDKLLEISSEFSHKALRVLALAMKVGDEIKEEDLTFVGFVGMVDPARPEAKHAVDIFKQAGITTIMITGDHRDTAFAIANELGICDNKDQCLLGSELDGLSDEEIIEKVKGARVFARVSPENKVQIVKALKADGSIAAMTGDGVNDAPSLKAADIGIAMGITGTDVAKGAADMVLTDDNFASIEKAVEEGRGIYANIKKTVWFLLSSNVGEVVAMFVAVCLGLPVPLVATQILWVNLVTDSTPGLALGSDPKDPDVMKDQPRDPKESLFAHGGYASIFGYGIWIGLITLMGFLIFPIIYMAEQNIPFSIAQLNAELQNNPHLLSLAETTSFTVLGLSELFHMFGMRTPTKSAFRIFKNPNWLLIGSFFLGIALQILVVETPGLNTFFNCESLINATVLTDTLGLFTGAGWVIALAFAVTPLLIHEIIVFILWIVKKVQARRAVNA